jgi:serine protease AprX
MKKILSLSLVAVVFLTIFVATKPKTQKLSPFLKYTIEKSNDNQYGVYIYLKDKGPNAETMLSKPLSLVTQRSLDRRSKVLPQGHLVDLSDVPLYEPYVNEVNSKVTNIRHELKWFNAISADVTLEQLYNVADLNCVEKIDLIERFKKQKEDIESNFSDKFFKTNSYISSDKPLTDSLNYGTGAGYQQLTQINVNLVHNQGIFGQGVIIASFDAGFAYYSSHPVFTTLPMNIYRKKDFHTGDTATLTSHSHGEGTLSLVGGYHPGNMIGPSFRSTFILCRTEVDPGERWFEMDHWAAAAQWVDSLGADIITSSLGYLEFDSPDSSYTWQHMNGKTLLITRAAAYAAYKGIVVSNSAGNNDYNASHNTLGGPADADSILTIGAVDLSGVRASFSSVGPTTDVPSRYKPDLMTCGSGNKVASGSTGYSSFGSGTSYACPLNAGVVGLMLSANKTLTPLEIRRILRNTASNSSSPNNLIGWGIVNAKLAVDSARKYDALSPTILHTQPFANTTNTGIITLKTRIYDNGIIRTWSNEAPRIYYRKSTNNGVNWTSYTSANFTSTTTRDTFYFQIPGSSIGTKVEYYFAAQDIALPGPRCTTLPAGGSGVNPPGSTAPGTRFTFNVTTSISVISSIVPDEYKLFNNYPNPFNPITMIKFDLVKTSDVKLKVYDITGRLITTLVNQRLSAGEYKVDFSGIELSSGVYIYRIEAGDFKDTKKMLLIK